MEYLEKTTNLPQVTDKLYQWCIEYTSHDGGFELTTLVVIGTDCICIYKSNYISATAPYIHWNEWTKRSKWICTISKNLLIYRNLYNGSCKTCTSSHSFQICESKLHVTTFQQQLHMEYISLSWYLIIEVVVPIIISVVEVYC